jgi:outer membrane receptor protein involved in Fe transport
VGKSSFLYRYNNPQNYWGEYINRVVMSYDNDVVDDLRSTTNLSNLIYRMDNNSSLGLTYLEQDKTYQYSASDDLLAEQIFTYTPIRNLEIIAGGSYQYSGNLPVTDYLDAPFNGKQYSAYSKTIDYKTLSGIYTPEALTFTNTAVFLQGYYKTKRFTFMGGSRYDDNSLYGNKLSPRFAVLYKWSDKTTIRTSAGYAYKAPPSSLTYQSVSFPVHSNPDSIKYLVVPNPSLKPEEFSAYELGIHHTFFDKIDFNVSLYYNEIKNLIINNNLPVRSFNLPDAYIETDTSTLLYRQNISGAISRLYGIQAGLKIENLIRPIQLDVEGSVTFTRQSQTIPGVEQIKEIFNSFSLTPRHLGQYKISFIPYKNVYVRLEGIWMSNWLKIIVPFQRIYDELFSDIDGFYKMDAVVNYSFNRHLISFIKINNVFDEKYGGLNSGGLNNGLPYNPQFGRYVQFGLTYTLN